MTSKPGLVQASLRIPTNPCILRTHKQPITILPCPIRVYSQHSGNLPSPGTMRWTYWSISVCCWYMAVYEMRNMKTSSTDERSHLNSNTSGGNLLFFMLSPVTWRACRPHSVCKWLLSLVPFYNHRGTPGPCVLHVLGPVQEIKFYYYFVWSFPSPRR